MSKLKTGLIDQCLVPIELREPITQGSRWTSPDVPEPLPEPFCLGINNDLTFHPAYKIGYLEMYGGSGLGTNAGGVRVANIDRIQIKGIGSTFLAGARTDKWHRHGALSLQDAVRESIFGELFNIASPYGAVRAWRIVDLGVNFETEIGEEKLPGSAPRALLYREQSIRVAHFMRSSFMCVSPALRELEMKRMEQGIPKLVDWLVRQNETGRRDFDSVLIAVEKIFERIIHQVAVLRTKRLIHGSLIPSNFCVDGRLLDFTTCTAAGTLRPVLITPGGLTSQQQHTQVLESLPDLIFYISKFDARYGVRLNDAKEVAAKLTNRLMIRHHNLLMEAHLLLFGFSTRELELMSLRAKRNLLDVLIRALSIGSKSGYMYFGGDEHVMPDQSGINDPYSLIVLAIATVTGLNLPGSKYYDPDCTEYPLRLHDQIIEAYGYAIADISGRGQSKLSLRELGISILIRAMRANADLAPLYRRLLDGKINDICSKRADFAEFINETIKEWSGVFEERQNGDIRLSGWLCKDEVFLLSTGELAVPGMQLVPSDLCLMRMAPNIRDRHRWIFEVAVVNSSHH
jgi:hypothetical protein